jgi:integrase
VSSIRQTHWVLNAALVGAVRWRWIGRNPLDSTPPPPLPASNPSPPSPVEAARLLEEAWRDPDWGAFVWTAMTTGARRGELCDLKRGDVDLDAKVMHVRTGLKLADRRLVRRDTKTHQQRRIALDDETVAVLAEHLDRVDGRAAQLDVTVGPDAYLFSLAPDGSTPLIPDTATQRYDRMAKRRPPHGSSTPRSPAPDARPRDPERSSTGHLEGRHERRPVSASNAGRTWTVS